MESLAYEGFVGLAAESFPDQFGKKTNSSEDKYLIQVKDEENDIP